MSSPLRSAGVGLVALALSGLVRAQAPPSAVPSRPAVPAQAAVDRLPVRRVVLYKSGVGYFEHLGRVRGNQTVTIDFSSSQLNDVLKSLTALDLDGGRVLSVRYNSEAGLDRRLSALQLPVGSRTNRAEFLSAIRGARVEVRSGAARRTGRLLSVERLERMSGSAVSQIDAISIVTDAGELETFALDAGVSVRWIDADLTQEVGKYLSVMGSVRTQDVRRLSIATSGTGDRDLFVSYISEVPVWKPTYRIVLPPAGTARKPLLQAWAIIDNTVGDDWTNVELSLVAGAPQSFIQRLSQPYYVQRPIVPLPLHASVEPQTHQAALATAGVGVLVGAVTDSTGGVIPGATVRVTRNNVTIEEATADSSGRYRITGLSQGSYAVEFSLSGFKTAFFGGVKVSGGMETILNATLEVGGVHHAVTVMAETAYDRASAVQVSSAAIQSEAAASPLGELFEYKLKTPITIPKNQSALVPILAGEVEVEQVSVWNFVVGRTRPMRAVWLTNTTGATLDAGSFSVSEAEAFAGEGLMEPLKAGERRLLSYAADLAVHVDVKAEPVPLRMKKVRIARGVVMEETEERERHTYTVRNGDAEPRVMVLEHAVRDGWTIGGTVEPAETTSSWYRFKVTVAPKTTVTFTVDDIEHDEREYAVSSITDDHVAVLVQGRLIPAQMETALRQILAQKAEVARLAAEISARAAEAALIGKDQARLRENLKSLRGSAEERQLVQRYVRQLDDQETRLTALRKEQDALEAARQKAHAEMVRMIDALQ